MIGARVAGGGRHHGLSSIVGATINSGSGPVLHAPATLQALVTATPSGGTLTLPAGIFSGTATIPVQMTINGAGIGSTIIDCTGLTPAQQKAVLVTSVAATVIGSMTIRGAAIPAPDGNAAGVRDGAAGASFTLNSVEITGCQNGILCSSNPTLNNCNIHDNGNGNPGNGYTHELYFTTGVTTAILSNTNVTNGTLATHSIHSRAGTLSITNGTLTGTNDNGTYGGSVIDLAEAGACSLTGTTLVARGSNSIFIGYRAENANQLASGHTVALAGVHLTDQTGTGGSFVNYSNTTTNSALTIDGSCVYDGTIAPSFAGGAGWVSITGSFAAAGSGNLPVTFGIANPTGTTFVTPEFSFVHEFGKGDIPSGSKIAALAPQGGGSAVAVQQDRERYWSDGSLWKAEVSIVNSDTFLGNATRNYSVSGTAGSPTRTPFITLAQLRDGATINSVVFAATDFKLKIYGGDLGTDIFNVGVTDIIANGSNFPWGANPLRGWEIVRAGPNCCEWRFWSYLRRVSPADNAFHRWVQIALWVRVWKSGKYEIGCYPKQPNSYGPAVGATVGAASLPPRHACIVELYNGASLLYSWGGVNDTRVTSGAMAVAPGAINTSTNVLTLTAQQIPFFANVHAQGGVPVTIDNSGGGLPGGVLANTVYWPTSYPLAIGFAPAATFYLATSRLVATNAAPWAASTQYGAPFGPSSASVVFCNNALYVATNVSLAVSASSGTGPSGGGSSISDGGVTWACASVIFTSQGSGTHRLIPITHTTQFSGWIGLDSTFNRIWVGSGTRPPLLPVHDRDYMVNKAKVIPNYKFAETTYPAPTTFPNVVNLGNQEFLHYLQTTGDGPGDERIQEITHTALLALYRQTDPGWDQNAKCLAAQWADYNTNCINNTTGKPVVCNNGPDRVGGNYTNLGTTNPAFWTDYRHASNPDLVIASNTVLDSAGYQGVGNPQACLVDASHLPAWWIVPYHRSSDDIWRECGEMLATATISTAANRNQTLSGVGPLGGIVTDPNWMQVRGLGWGLHAVAFYDRLMADGDPLRPYIKDCMDDNDAYLGGWAAAQTSAMRTLGYYGNTGVFVDTSSWQACHCVSVFGQEALTGERPGITSFLVNHLSKWLRGLYDSDLGGSEYWIGSYYWRTQSGGVPYATFAALMADVNNLGAGWTAPATGFPAYGAKPVIVFGFGGGPNYPSYPNDATGALQNHVATFAILSRLGVPNALVIYNRIVARMAGAGGIYFGSAVTQDSFPDLEILP